MFTEAVDVTVTPTITRTNNRMVFLPADATTDVYANLVIFTALSSTIDKFVNLYPAFQTP